MRFPDFAIVDFPKKKHLVYVLEIDLNGDSVPFYVGQSSKWWGRIGDYLAANFTASTGFKVGEAVKCFEKGGHKVKIEFAESQSPLREKERELLFAMKKQKRILLNDMPNYNYKKANPSQERRRINRFVEGFLRSNGVYT